MNRDRICMCCLGFLIKPQKDLNTFDKQDEREPVIRARDPQLLHSCCTGAIILISVSQNWAFLVQNSFSCLVPKHVQCSVIVFCQYFNQIPGNAKNADNTDFQFCFFITHIRMVLLSSALPK